MAKSQQTFNKKEKEKKRLKKRKDKQARLEERRSNSKGSSLEDMIAYVDENGNITDTPPDTTRKNEINIENIEVSVAKKIKEELPTVREGKVEFFNENKGFGFIFEPLTQEKYFVHVNGLIDKISDHDKVNFEIEKGLKGWNAIKVKRI